MAFLMLLTTLAVAAPHDTSFASIVLDEFRRHPILTRVDLYKLAHQAAFGAEHSIPDSANAAEWLAREWGSLPDRPEAIYDTIAPGGALVRLNLRAWRDGGGSRDVVLAAFLETGRSFERRPEVFERYWATIVELARLRRVPFDPAVLRRHGDTMRVRGYPAVSHSAEYRAAYQPAYRVVKPEIVQRLRH
ncbi:MAG: hypothetical protein H0W15_02430 [Gemmatimonadales bacterium]|nr:hypothetical protein [Gemmatimonadales bacterium]